jgi:hypothetical protein
MALKQKTRKGKRIPRTRYQGGFGTITQTVVQPQSPVLVRGPPQGPLPTHWNIHIEPSNTPIFNTNNSQQGLSTAIPSLTNIQPHVSFMEYRYLEELLRKISSGALHEAYYNEDKTSTYFYFVLDDIVNLIQQEIHHITTSYKSGKFAFDEESSVLVINELNKYIQYFTNCANEYNQVDIQCHEVLFP